MALSSSSLISSTSSQAFFSSSSCSSDALAGNSFSCSSHFNQHQVNFMFILPISFECDPLVVNLELREVRVACFFDKKFNHGGFSRGFCELGLCEYLLGMS